MIGILLALQVNNWNEARKSNTLEIEFINRLKNDLVSDTAYFRQRKKEADYLIEQHRLFLVNAHQEQKSIGEVRELMCCIDYPPTELHITTTTYSELVSTGKINIIRNTAIREKIIQHYEDYNRINKHLLEFDMYSNQVLANITSQVNPLTLLKKYLPNPEDHILDSWRFINDPGSEEFQSLEIIVVTFLDKFEDYLVYLEEMDRSTRNLLFHIGNQP